MLVYNSAALMTNNCVQYVRNFCQTNLISVIWNSLQLLNGFENLCNPTVWSKGVDTDPHGSVFKMQILIQKSKIICWYPNKFKKIGCKCYFIFKILIYFGQRHIFLKFEQQICLFELQKTSVAYPHLLLYGSGSGIQKLSIWIRIRIRILIQILGGKD